MTAPASIGHLDRVLRVATALYAYDLALPGGDHVTGVTDWRVPGNDAAKATPFLETAREIRRMYCERAEAAITAADQIVALPPVDPTDIKADPERVVQIKRRSAASKRGAQTRRRMRAA